MDVRLCLFVRSVLARHNYGKDRLLMGIFVALTSVTKAREEVKEAGLYIAQTINDQDGDGC
jgi:hypothetical protein